MVTGAGGFVGSNLVDALLLRGCDVVGIDSRDLADPIVASNLGAASSNGRFSWHHRDLLDAGLDAALDSADIVFHLAAVAGVRDSWGSHRFSEYVRANILATQRVIDACEHTGVRRLVVASSSSVYGETRWASKESDVLAPASPYGVSKLAAEQLCLAHARRRDTALTVVALRYFTVFGPRQRAGMGINQALLSALSGSTMPLYGDGEQRREFTFIDDIVTATIAAAHVDVESAVVNVGGGANPSMREVLNLASSLTGAPVPVSQQAPRAGDVGSTSADLTAARHLLGYRPTVGLEEGMARQLAWLTELSPPLRQNLLCHNLTGSNR